MRIDEASKLMEIPAQLISEIIEEHKIDVDQYINGNHDLTFKAMVQISNIYEGIRKRVNVPQIDWKERAQALQKQVYKLQIKLGERKTKEKWYPRKVKKGNEVTV